MKAIAVSVVCAWPDQVWRREIEVPEGSTVGDALATLPWQAVTGLDPATLRTGLFGRLVGLDEVLRAADRIELYRPLLIDPKQVRRERAGTPGSTGRR